MDKLTKYREIIRQVLPEYGHRPSNGNIQPEIIIDPQHDHYEIMHVGWDKHRRVHGCVIHLDIIDNKIWVQYDGTNWPITDRLVEMGVPKSDIVLAFHPEQVRSHTGYAVG